MQTENDREFYRRMAPVVNAVQAHQNEPYDSLAFYAARYRTMIEGFGAMRIWPTWPTVGAYYPSVELRPGLTAGVAVPNGTGPFPVALHTHGNALIGGDSESFRRTTLDFAHAGFVTVMPSYRLAPEHQFPAAFDDMIFAHQWITQSISHFGGDPTKVIITGNSAGSTLAMAIARAIWTSGEGPPLRGVVGMDGLYPDGSTTGNKVYLGADAEALSKDPRVSPAAGLKPGMLPPEIFLSTGSADFLGLATLQFATLLRKLQIRFELHLLEGAGHDAIRYPQLDASRELLALFTDFGHKACGTAPRV